MKLPKRAWLWLVDAIGYSVPDEISPDMPRTLEEYRERRALNEKLVEIARRRVREYGQ